MLTYLMDSVLRQTLKNKSYTDMKSQNKNLSRRKFLQATSLAAGSFMIVPRHVLGRGFIPPSDQLHLAAIGAGGKGTSDIRNAYNEGKNKVVALCDIDSNQAKDSIKRFPKAAFYKDFRKMLDEMEKDIDAVTISTPDHNHGVAAMFAMQRGMHVYVQKPLTHNIYEARQLTEGARKYKVVSQMGNQGASNPGQVQMIEWFNQGLIGTVHTVHVWTNRPVWPQGISSPEATKERPKHISAQDWELFIGPAETVPYDPLYHPFKWRGWWNFGTGALGDMGCHLIDPPFRVLQLGYPTSVESSVSQVFKKDWVPEHLPESCPPASVSKIMFSATKVNPSPIELNWYDGGIRPFHPELVPTDEVVGEGSNGVIMIGDKGVMTCGTYGRNPRLYRKGEDTLTMPEDYTGGNALVKLPEYGHQVHWTEACKAGFGSDQHQALTSSFDYSGPLTETVLMGNLAIRSSALAKKGNRGRMDYYGRRKLIWDGDNMEVTNFKEANQFVKRSYRKGWRLI